MTRGVEQPEQEDMVEDAAVVTVGVAGAAAPPSPAPAAHLVP
jgi:hypothetical protein